MIMQLQDRYREFCPRCEGLKPSSLVYYNLYELLDYMEANNYMNKENMLHNFLKWEFKLYLDLDRYDQSDDEGLIKQLEVYMKGIRLKLNVKYEDDYIWIKVN
ncbi:hypothetical protein [Bacillus mycoides]|uniref:hypothetical protein n=1 Tax=Bacillus mycoides TaxID=1405 RepID=UPI0038051BD2